MGARVPQPQQRYSRPLQRRGCRVRWSRGRSPPPAGLYRRRRPGRFPPSRRTASNPDNGKTQRRRELETHFTRSVLLSMWYNIENHRSLLFLSSLPRFNREHGRKGMEITRTKQERNLRKDMFVMMPSSLTQIMIMCTCSFLLELIRFIVNRERIMLK